MNKPCAVETCPAFAPDGSVYCPGHRTAKRLLAVHTGRTCTRCARALHAGDYVTIDSTADRLTHAMCPTDAPIRRTKRSHDIPLLEGA